MVSKKHVRTLSGDAKKIIQDAIDNKLAKDPISYGKPLRYNLNGYRRLRVGNYRVIYKIKQKENIVLIIAILHRKEIYKDLG